MKEYHQFYINGSWVDPINGLNKLDVLSPATEESIGSIALGLCVDDTVHFMHGFKTS